MKSVLLGATVLMGLSVPAWASGNNIFIDTTNNGGSVKTLSIIQDDSSITSQVSGNVGGTTALPVAGSWKSISINQQGGNAKFYGSLTTDASSINATLTAQYHGGKNSHSISIGGTTAPVDPTVAIDVTNNGSTTNSITDTLDGTSLSYKLTVLGTGNMVTNKVSTNTGAGIGAITLNQGGIGGYGITGSNNSVTNNVSSVDSFTHNLTILGNSNVISNTANGGGNKTITQAITGDSNLITMGLTAFGDQTAMLTVPSNSTVDYTLDSAASSSSTIVNLTDVKGAGGIPAVIRITQTGLADGAKVNLDVVGTNGTFGTGLTSGSGVYVYQNSLNANLDAKVTANAPGFTANFTQ
jgi:hypothetical protein